MKPVLIIAISLFTVSLSCQTMTPSLERCASIDDPVERYACYDKLAGRSPARTPTVSSVEPKPNAEATSVLDQNQVPIKDRSDEFKFKWTKIQKDAMGKLIISLENGQVWRQTDSRRFIFENPEHWVIISRSLGSGFFLKEPESKIQIRVKLANADTTKPSGKVPGAGDPVASGADVVVPAAPAETPTVSPVEPEPSAEATFGLEYNQIPKKDRSDEFKFKWTKIQKDAMGKWIIFLENGQVWRQTDSRRFTFVNSEPWVIISRSFGSGFFLKEPGRKIRIRVKRAK